MCFPGYFQQYEKSSRCYKCAPDTFAHEAGSTKCASCPLHSSNFIAEYLGYYMNSLELEDYVQNSSTQCICKSGFFMDSATGVCVPCPQGGVCCQCADTNIQTQEFYVNSIQAPCPVCLAGAAPMPTRGFLASMKTRNVIIQCPVHEACAGGPDSRCAPNYEGPR